MKRDCMKAYVCLALICFIAFAGCEKPAAKAKKKTSTQETYTEQPPAYEPPDRGFGTVNDATDVRSQTDQDSKRSEEAVDAIQ